MRALLYSHGLAIEDPLSHAAEMHLSQHRDLRAVTRAGISTAAASLSEIAQPLDNDVVNVFYTGGDELGAAGELGDSILTTLDADASLYTVADAWDEFEVEFVSGLSPALQAPCTRGRPRIGRRYAAAIAHPTSPMCSVPWTRVTVLWPRRSSTSSGS